MTEQLKITCPCLFGLESVLSGEIKRMGGQEVQVQDGKVSFSGGWEMVARANLCLRTAERVLVELGSFKARSFEELFQGVKALPLEEFIGIKDAFPVKGWSLNSKLASVPDCQAIIKKAAVERLKQTYHVSWFEETGPVHQLQFSIHKDVACLFLDTSGAGLHKRGYRKNSTLAPIKETLAAGILDLARVRSHTVLIDPFCGSGTFSIEGALKAFHIPPGIHRRFAAENWESMPALFWKQERARGLEGIKKDAEFEAYASDIDPAAVELTLENAKKAGVAPRIRARQADIRQFSCKRDNAVIVCNPPYGERLLEIKEAQAIYRVMGERFDLSGSQSFAIISPDEKFETFFGAKASKRRKLYNGMIKCQLYQYFNSKLNAPAKRGRP